MSTYDEDYNEFYDDEDRAALTLEEQEERAVAHYESYDSGTQSEVVDDMRAMTLLKAGLFRLSKDDLLELIEDLKAQVLAHAIEYLGDATNDGVNFNAEAAEMDRLQRYRDLKKEVRL